MATRATTRFSFPVAKNCAVLSPLWPLSSILSRCDFHTRYQQIAMAEETTGELLLERRLDHESPGRSTAIFTDRYAWESRPPDPFTGSSVCSRNSVMNSGWGTPRR